MQFIDLVAHVYTFISTTTNNKKKHALLISNELTMNLRKQEVQMYFMDV